MKIEKVRTKELSGKIVYYFIYKNGDIVNTYLPITRLPSFITEYNIEIIDEGDVYYHDEVIEDLDSFYKANKSNIEELLTNVISECILDFSNYLNFIYQLRR